jgi:hypothetical protein
MPVAICIRRMTSLPLANRPPDILALTKARINDCNCSII